MKRSAGKNSFVILLISILIPVQTYSQQSEAHIKIAGHRGGYYDKHPESSLSLFGSIAKKFKSDTIIIEVDLRKSKDGTIYIMHDETVDRTTSGNGKIALLGDTYLNSLYLKKENGQITREQIPTFASLLDYIKKKNINLMLDIKIPIHAEAYALVKKYKMESRMLTLTFHMDITRKAAALSDQILLSALIVSDSDWHQFKDINLPVGKKIAYINKNTSTSLIYELKKSQIKLMTDVSEALNNAGKPLDKTSYQKKVIEHSLDIIITDYPIEARNALLLR